MACARESRDNPRCRYRRARGTRRELSSSVSSCFIYSFRLRRRACYSHSISSCTDLRQQTDTSGIPEPADFHHIAVDDIEYLKIAHGDAIVWLAHIRLAATRLKRLWREQPLVYRGIRLRDKIVRRLIISKRSLNVPHCGIQLVDERRSNVKRVVFFSEHGRVPSTSSETLRAYNGVHPPRKGRRRG